MTVRDSTVQLATISARTHSQTSSLEYYSHTAGGEDSPLEPLLDSLKHRCVPHADESIVERDCLRAREHR